MRAVDVARVRRRLRHALDARDQLVLRLGVGRQRHGNAISPVCCPIANFAVEIRRRKQEQ